MSTISSSPTEGIAQSGFNARGAGRGLRLQRRMAPYVFVSPFVLVFGIFGAWPILRSLEMAFFHTVTPSDQNFAGLRNFQYLLVDPDFHMAVRNTLVYTLCSVLIQLPLALLLAVLLNAKWLRGRSFFRLAFFSPNLMGQVFVGILFQVLFTPTYGLVNQAFHRLFGLPLDTKWLTNPDLVMPALVLASLWMYVGFNMIYFLAALQAVDKELYDAAVVDGANSWQSFRAVTLPSIKPVAVFVLVTATIGSFQLFELPWIMLNSSAGPDNSGLTVVMYLYQWGFIQGNLGYASAVGWTLAIGVLIISVLQVRLTGAFKGTQS